MFACCGKDVGARSTSKLLWFKKAEFISALKELDRELGTARIFQNQGRLSLVSSVGSYLNRSLVEGRHRMPGLFYLVDEDDRTESYSGKLQELERAAGRVAARKGWHAAKWVGPHATATYRRKFLRMGELIDQSITQNLKLFDGQNLVVYAIPLDLYLVQLMSPDSLRQEPTKWRSQHIRDAVAVLYEYNTLTGRRMTHDHVRHRYLFWWDGAEPRDAETYIKLTQRAYREKYGRTKVKTPGIKPASSRHPDDPEPWTTPVPKPERESKQRWRKLRPGQAKATTSPSNRPPPQSEGSTRPGPDSTGSPQPSSSRLSDADTTNTWIPPEPGSQASGRSWNQRTSLDRLDLSTIIEESRGLTGGSRALTGESRALTGESRGLTAERRGLTAEIRRQE